jgi:MFS transporter, ACS family, D-galactonate transporter
VTALLFTCGSWSQVDLEAAKQGTIMPKSTIVQTAPGAWKITALLFVYMMINFADKIAVGLAGVPIMKEMNLTPEQFGLVGSSFFFLPSITSVLVGFSLNKVETRWVVFVLAIIWALTQFPLITSISFSTLLISRIVLGAGEGPAYAVVLHSIYKWFPDEKRTLPTAIVNQGSAFGVIIAIPALNWLIVHFNWHTAFGALGVVGLLWAMIWLRFGKDGPITSSSNFLDEEPNVPYLRLLLTRTFIGCSLSTFGAYWVMSVALTWLTPFIVKGLGYSQSTAGWISIFPWVEGTTVLIGTALLSQRLMSKGVSSRVARGVVGGVPLILAGVLLTMTSFAENPAAKIALLILGSGLCGAIYVVSPPMLSEITPVKQRGAIISVYSAIFNLAGIISPVAMGSIIQHSITPLEGYLAIWKVSGAILMVAGVIGLLLLRPDADRLSLQGK